MSTTTVAPRAAALPPLETPVTIASVWGTLLGVATRTARAGNTVVLIVPAPGESRTGPARLHVRLARALAQAGIPSLRFDAADGGDSMPSTAVLAGYDDVVAAAARQLLTLHPDAFVALLAAGRATAPAARAWTALSHSHVPLSALCLLDPTMTEVAVPRPRSLWQRLFGARGERSIDQRTAAPITADAAHPDVADPHLWLELPREVRAARARLLVATRSDDPASAAVERLVADDAAWRRAERRAGGWLSLRESDASHAQPVPWRELNDWLAQRLVR